MDWFQLHDTTHPIASCIQLKQDERASFALQIQLVDFASRSPSQHATEGRLACDIHAKRFEGALKYLFQRNDLSHQRCPRTYDMAVLGVCDGPLLFSRNAK